MFPARAGHSENIDCLRRHAARNGHLRSQGGERAAEAVAGYEERFPSFLAEPHSHFDLSTGCLRGVVEPAMNVRPVGGSQREVGDQVFPNTGVGSRNARITASARSPISPHVSKEPAMSIFWLMNPVADENSHSPDTVSIVGFRWLS